MSVAAPRRTRDLPEDERRGRCGLCGVGEPVVAELLAIADANRTKVCEPCARAVEEA